MQDKKAPQFTLENKIYCDQLRKGLVMNIYRSGTWGSYRHLRLDGNLSSSATALQVEHAYINTLTRGDLASLRWIEGPLTFYRLG